MITLRTAQFVADPVPRQIQPDPMLARLEAALVKLYREAGEVFTSRARAAARRTLTSGQRLNQTEAMQLLEELAREARFTADTVNYRRRLATILRRLETLGMVEIRAEMRDLLTRRGEAAEPALEQPQRVSRADARYYEEQASVAMHEHMLDVRDRTQAQVIRGLEAGLSDADIGARLFTEGVVERRDWARTWARTETTRYYTMGRVKAGEEAEEYTWGYEYAVILDERTTDICRAFVGKIVAKADLVLLPPFHWNCRTTLFPVMMPEFGGDISLPRLAGEPAVVEGFGVDPRTGRQPANTVKRAVSPYWANRRKKVA